ncbi:MAG: flagellar basal body rod protein FlgB [Fibromonadaceae bacterium]|jgi:flagellar basal-body rod protein FlgB|nr:flagellar basal body rod protein FlgB [Fibromonadaceae bacterium]
MLTKLAILDKTSIPVASKGLDAYAHRGRAIANNIANVSTPGYRRIEVSFEDQLRRALDKQLNLAGERTDGNHLFLGRPELEHVKSEGYRVDDYTNPGEINNVDIDIEMAKLAENEIAFNFAATFIKDRSGAIGEAIRGSRFGGE